MVEELLLGDNPFIGVSHLAQERAREEVKELSLERKKEVISAAVEAGATGFTFSTHDANLELIDYLAKTDRFLLERLNYYILTPYAFGYVRRATPRGMVGLVRDVLKSLVGKGSTLYVLRTITTLDVRRLATLFIANEVKPYLYRIPRERVKAILLHEVVTELLIAYDAIELAEVLRDYIKEKMRIGFGLETRNVARLLEWLDKHGLRVDYVMTPMNKIGYQMAPSKEEAEKAIVELSRRARIIAVNILASGALGIDDAIDYLKGFRDNMYAVAVGTSKPWRARENFSKLRGQLLA